MTLGLCRPIYIKIARALAVLVLYCAQRPADQDPVGAEWAGTTEVGRHFLPRDTCGVRETPTPLPPSI